MNVLKKLAESFKNDIEKEIQYELEVKDRVFPLTKEEACMHWDRKGVFKVCNSGSCEIIDSQDTNYRLSTILNSIDLGAIVTPVWL